MMFECCAACKTGLPLSGSSSDELLYIDHDGGGPYCERCYFFQLQIVALSIRIYDLEQNARLDQIQRISKHPFPDFRDI